MRGITIEAKSLDSARCFYDALSEFDPKLLGSEDEGYRVTVQLRNYDREVLALLNALERHVTERHAGPARIELNGRRYTMHADSTAGAA